LMNLSNRCLILIANLDDKRPAIFSPIANLADQDPAILSPIAILLPPTKTETQMAIQERVMDCQFT
jgi:hypothetical protein